ncbi:MAG: hypothetical protein LBJ88_07090, partial [Campylobacteraceae bacterium]|nr:hypothetical protein [Campylobacteraceae bacterium]
MKTIVQLSLALLTALTINGCGGGGGGSSDKSTPSNNNDISISDSNTTNTTQPETNTTNPETNTCIDGGKIKHGHQLPPCPDPIKNDETLLGIDSNNNGVRDDVEIWIYNTYDTYKICKDENYTIIVDGTRTSTGKPIISNGTRVICDGETQPFHQIVREVAMQHARAFQIVIQEPEKARETVNIMHAALDCG